MADWILKALNEKRKRQGAKIGLIGG